ncbi:Ig-like domain-containing protein [Roseateles sp. SL47]|uniref:Ig-like domain repeat protein n=1 Tax=Roseateles sp. SL47 TaxID=2995138 RepID=UPI00226D9344|nr:Ig-like domain-containing protein [Roseateles sp. SL47]WAC71785.1 Ig-like domain-containing protein [Roseateles sp. SL47]
MTNTFRSLLSAEALLKPVRKAVRGRKPSDAEVDAGVDASADVANFPEDAPPVRDDHLNSDPMSDPSMQPGLTDLPAETQPEPLFEPPREPLAAAAEATVSSGAPLPASLQAPADALEASRPTEDDRDRGGLLWGLAAVTGATGLALLGRGSGAPVRDIAALDPSAGLPGAANPDQPGAGAGPQHPDATTDPTTPTTPSIPVQPPPNAGRLLLRLHTDTGASALDTITSDGALTLQLEGQDAGTEVRYQRSSDGGVTWQDCGDTLQWLPDGRHLLRAVVSNAAGESVTSSVGVTVDGEAPTVHDLQVQGNAEPGSVQLSVGPLETGATVHYELSQDQGLTWLRTGATQPGLLDGRYLFRAVVTDLAGNQSITNVQTFTIDTEAPAVQALQLRKVGEQGWSSLSPLSCTGDVNLLLTLSGDTTAIYQHSSDGGLTWTPVDATVRGLPEGLHSFRAILQDAAGHQTVLDPVSLTVDTTPPDTAILNALVPGGSGNINSGYRSTTGTFDLAVSSFSGQARVSYEVRLDGTTQWLPCGAVVTGALDGRYEVRATFQDPAGNRSYSNIIQIEVDGQRAGAGSIGLANFLDTGTSALDRITSDGTFDLVHRPAGSVSAIQWQVSNNLGASWRNTTASQSNLQDGRYSFRALVTDDQGTVYTTRTIDMLMDAQPPSVPTLNLLNLDDTGASSTDRVTQNGQFSLSITDVARSATGVIEVSQDGGRTWNETSTQQDLSPGSYLFRPVAIDAGGGRAIGAEVAVTIDRQAPQAGPLQLADFTDTGLAGDRLTADDSFTLTLPSLEPGATLRFLHSSDGGLTWNPTAALQSDLAEGEHGFKAEVTDLAGNTTLGQVVSVTIDRTPPEAGYLQLTAHPGDGLELQWQGAESVETVAYQVSVDQGQQWLPVLSHTDALPPGDYLFRAVVTDAAGHTATTEIVAWKVEASEGTTVGMSPPEAFIVPDPLTGTQAFDATEATWAQLLANTTTPHALSAPTVHEVL